MNLVYIDESGIGKDLVDFFSWLKKGTNRVLKVSGKRTKKLNVIAAKTNNGIEAPFVFEGSCTTDLFLYYIKEVLCPILRAGQVIVMDNASFHKSPEIKKLIEERGCKLIYLPPYSPEHNPIEHYWAVLKKCIKKLRKNDIDVWDSVFMALSITQKFGLS